jgi:hypothetical protein
MEVSVKSSGMRCKSNGMKVNEFVWNEVNMSVKSNGMKWS